MSRIRSTITERERVVGSVQNADGSHTDRCDCLISWSFFTLVDGVRTGAFLIHVAPEHVDSGIEAKGCYAVSHVFTHLHLPYLFKEEDDALEFAEELALAMADKVMVTSPLEFQKNLHTVPDLCYMAERHNLHLYISLPVEQFLNEIAGGYPNE